MFKRDNVGVLCSQSKRNGQLRDSRRPVLEKE
jgi:hypothetical protein